MGRVLHILLNPKGLDKYPSVYNALYCWSKLGWSNYIITSGGTDEFTALITQEYRFSGGYAKRAAQLAHISGYFDIAIVYDPQDVEAFYATRYLFPRNAYRKLVHHCLEIPVGSSNGRSLFTKLLHKMLGGGYQLIDHLIIQDKSRGDLFFNTFPGLKTVPWHLVTNSFINVTEPVAPSLRWFDDLRTQSKFLVLYTGTIERWAFPERLFETLLGIQDATFLFSGWSDGGYAEGLAERYRMASNIRFHIGAKRRAEFNYMVANADVGLVCYESPDQNVREVGLSSGKLHKFLSFQKPVLTNGISSLHHFITHNGFGMSVPVGDFRAAVRQLADSHQTFCENIRKRYTALCNFEEEYMAFVQAVVNRAHEPDNVLTFEESRAC